MPLLVLPRQLPETSREAVERARQMLLVPGDSAAEWLRRGGEHSANLRIVIVCELRLDLGELLPSEPSALRIVVGRRSAELILQLRAIPSGTRARPRSERADRGMSELLAE